MAAWKPRGPLDTSNPDQYESGSPEAALIEFLNAWKDKKYGVMAKRLDPFGDRTLNARAGEAREYYKDLLLHEFTFEKILDRAPAVTEITVKGRRIQL